MGNKKVKTGRTYPGTGFTVPQVNDTYDLLKTNTDQPALTGAANELLTVNPLEQNLATARNLAGDATDQFSRQLATSFLGRGIQGSGLATTALNAGRGQISGSLINDALTRSFGQMLQARAGGAQLMETKNNLNQLLANFVQGIVVPGIGGQTANYGARTGLAGQQQFKGFLGENPTGAV